MTEPLVTFRFDVSVDTLKRLIAALECSGKSVAFEVTDAQLAPTIEKMEALPPATVSLDEQLERE